MSAKTMEIGILGLGLIGGSMAKDLGRQVNVHVIGSDVSKAHADKALELGLVKEIVDSSTLIDRCQIIILAMPVDGIKSCVSEILDRLRTDQILIDTGSTKVNICASVTNHANRGRFVASHPLAGTEFSGPSAALSDLFNGKKNIICEAERSDAEAIEMAVQLYNSLGMMTTFMSAREHDRHLAYVSHLSHVSSFVLGSTVLDIEEDEKQILNLASTGFASTVRLAKSNPDTWSSIFAANSENIVSSIDHYIVGLQKLRNQIAAKDVDLIREFIIKANKIKKILN